MVSAHSKQSLLKGILVVYLISFGAHCSALNLVDSGTKDAEVKFIYTQYPIIRNGLIRNSAEFLGKFKKRALSRSNLRNASKNLRNGQCSDFQS